MVLFLPYSPGSVIADIELLFQEPVSESEIRELTKKITEDGSLGQLEVDSVSVGPSQTRELLCLMSVHVIYLCLLKYIYLSLNPDLHHRHEHKK